MNDKEKQDQQGQGQPPSQSSEQQHDKDESTGAGEERAANSPPPKVKGCFDDIETGEGTGARGGEYS